MYAGDSTGLSDPYTILSFDRYSIRSRVVKKSISPTWDQSMLIKEIRLFGDILDSPPPVVLEFFDEDQVVWLKLLKLCMDSQFDIKIASLLWIN